VRITTSVILVLVALVLLPNASLACRSNRYPKAVLLENVPTEAQNAPVVARVVIKEIYSKNFGPAQYGQSNDYARAQVVQAIKGVDVGKIIQIRASVSICSSALTRHDIGRDGIVAGEWIVGEFIGDEALVGFWDLSYARTGRQP
jgi:hypothetical protein